MHGETLKTEIEKLTKASIFLSLSLWTASRCLHVPCTHSCRWSKPHDNL